MCNNSIRMYLFRKCTDVMEYKQYLMCYDSSRIIDEFTGGGGGLSSIFMK